MDTNVGTHPGDIRWDIVPGRGLLAKDINIQDLTALIAGDTGNPPMLGGNHAFNGPPFLEFDNYIAADVYNPPPPATNSVYVNYLINDSDSDYWKLYAKGRDQGLDGHYGVVVVDFGGQYFDGVQWGTLDWHEPKPHLFHPNFGIERAVQGYIEGYWFSSSWRQHLTIVVGTNNSANANYASGQAWTFVVNDLVTWVSEHGYSSRIVIKAGNDIEMNYSSPLALG